MRPSEAEKILLQKLFQHSLDKKVIDECSIKSLDQLTGDASTRRYYRVGTNSRTYVICLDKVFKSDEESSFLCVHRVLKQNSIATLKIYDYEGESGYFLEEDLGDNTLLKFSHSFSKNEEFKYYKRAVDELIRIQKIDLKTLPNSITSLSFDNEKLMYEVDFSLKHLFKVFYKTDGEYGRADLSINGIRDEFEKIIFELTSKDMLLTHRDYHSRNIMIKDDKDISIIDFQDARLGIPVYDLASLLDDCYYQLNFENKESLLQYYFNKLSTYYDGFKDYNEFKYYYDLMTLQRTFKALGSFAYIYRERGDDRYLKYIGYGIEKIKRVMLSYEKFYPLKKLIMRSYYEY